MKEEVVGVAIALQKVNDNTYELNCCGYVCPYPQLFTQKALAKLSSGQVLRVVFDNPSSLETILQFCRREKLKVLDQESVNGKFRVIIQKP